MKTRALPASFRDPSGFLFRDGETLYRQINLFYRENYEELIGSGLYSALVSENLLIPHEDAPPEMTQSDHGYRVIRPEKIHFISYPHEWCFSQLKEAALTTLRIQSSALRFGMILKDASAYNIQFQSGRAVLIDTLSFEKYQEGVPWAAYRQFCQHFLAPLLLMSRVDIRLSQLFKLHIDGVPLDLASALLPWRTRLNLPILIHLHWHAAAQARYAGKPEAAQRSGGVSLNGLLGIIDSLRRLIEPLDWEPTGTEWADYYQKTSYSPAAMQDKEDAVRRFIQMAAPATVWDFGANTGEFSRIAGECGAHTISFDVDPAAVEKNHRHCIRNSINNVLPLVMDLTNPTSSFGWGGEERDSLLKRGPADLTLALALIHHLAISNNVPLSGVAHFLARTGRKLVIEFVPKEDPQVQRLLASRTDIFPEYTRSAFEEVFSRLFQIKESYPLRESGRILYIMQARQDPDSAG